MAAKDTRYEAKTFTKRLIFDGAPVTLFARLFVYRGRVRAVRSLLLKANKDFVAKVVDGTLDKLPPVLPEPPDVWRKGAGRLWYDHYNDGSTYYVVSRKRDSIYVRRLDDETFWTYRLSSANDVTVSMQWSPVA